MTRFGDKLTFHKQIARETEDRLVPSMILQPLIENSIKHGLAPKVDGGSIWLRTWFEGGRLHISIADNGVGIAPERLATIYEDGIGVSNVNERLRVLFGTSYTMSIESSPGAGTKTSIVLPELETYVPEMLRAVNTSV
jgi:two-component system LytT family sensor kinase